MSDELMLEYIFFHREPYDQFIRFLAAKNIKPLKEGIDETDVEGLVVCIQDNLDEPLSEEIELFYDEMMALNETLISEQDDSNELSKVGLVVSLSDGRSVLAGVDPQVLNKMLSVISHDELGTLVDAIANAVENPDERPLCKR